jgi:hypothetical protein
MIQTLEQALLRINDAVFQEFCNALIDLKYNPNSISPIGSVTGKMKTKKGQPDCYFKLENGDFIFAEYTTVSALNGRNALMKKLENDIKNCFKGITNPNRVNKVILCFTDNLVADEQLRLSALCQSLSENCKLEILGIRDLASCAKKYPSLASDYLGISLSSQILSPKEFMKRHERFTFSTPLANEFMWREVELAGALEYLDSSNAIILSGESGIGKTKLALQIGHEFCQTHQDFEFVCVGGPGESIFEDIRPTFLPDRKYLILVDDANRMANNYLQLLNLLVEAENGDIKIIATVRKYALHELKDRIAPFDVKILSIDYLSRQQLSDILTTHCKITNSKAVSKILDIAQENARIALMCAKIENDVLIHIKNPKDVFEHCYSGVLTLLKTCKDYKLALKSLALISFCRRVRKGAEKKLYSAFEIEEDQFWDCCIELCEYEIIDLFDRKAAKIPDQSLSTYLFREVFFNSGILDFRLILENFLDKKSLIVDSIIPIMNGFGEKEFIAPFKNKTLIPFWELVKEDEKRAIVFLQMFQQVLPTQTLGFLSGFMDGEQLETENQEYSFEYTDRDFQTKRDEKLSLLEGFRNNPEQLSLALELICQYGLRFPDKSAEVAYTLVHGYCIRYEDIKYEFQIQHLMVDFLIEKSQESAYYKQLAIVTIHKLISKTARLAETEPTGSSSGSMSIRSYHIPESESYLGLRAKCLKFLIPEFPVNRVRLLDVLIDVVFEPSQTEIIQSDARALCSSLLSKLDPNNFREAKFANDYFELIAKHKLTGFSIDKKKFNHPLYALSKELLPKRNERDISGKDTLQRKKMKEMCINLEVKPILNLIDNILLLKDQADSRWHHQYNNSIQYILESLAAESNSSRFIEVLSTSVKLLEQLNCFHIFDKYFSHGGNWRELYQILAPRKVELTYSFMYFCQTVPDNAMNEINVEYNLYEDFKTVLCNTQKSLRLNSVDFLSKFSSLVPLADICLDICNISITRDTDEIKICLGDNFYKIAEPYIKGHFETYSRLYLLERKNDTIFDFDGEILLTLLSTDPGFLCRYFDELVDWNGSWHMYEMEIDIIWNNQDHYNIFQGLLNHIVENDLAYKGQKFLKQLTRQNGHTEKILACLEKVVENYSADARMMPLVFKICPSQPNEFRNNLLAIFLLKNVNFSDFTNIDLLNKGMVTFSSPGSEVSIKVNDRLKIEKIRDLVAGLPNQLKFIKHLEYLEKKLHSLDDEIEYAKEQEFLWHSE